MDWSFGNMMVLLGYSLHTWADKTPSLVIDGFLDASEHEYMLPTIAHFRPSKARH